ncbi:MAG: DUF3320 domain-containing protein [Dehalococcoidia bacterium]
MTPESSMDQVAKRLENWKRQLIDLTRRNRLLNYKPSKASSVEIVDEVPQQIFRQLLEGNRFFFDPKPGAGGDSGAAEGLDEEDDGEEFYLPFDDEGERRRMETGRTLERGSGDLPEHHTDDRLQTNLSEVQLQKNLLTLFRKAPESIEEQGVNTLFLALGMLEWHEAESSDVVSKAPLVMVPVKLIRKTAATRFELYLGDDEPILNPAIVEKLRLDFKVKLPELPELSDDIDMDDVFQKIGEAVEGFPRWRLTADVVLGLFSFQKFIMYRDIERNHSLFVGHPVIQSICGVSSEPRTSGLPDDVAHANLDEEMSPWASIQVLDADSSQQRAILAVKKGHHLVIEGPPGTGKSQTITNLIADQLHAGRSVLFVAEKMAALEVVKSRLEHDGRLGEFVLELHSNKTSKTQFVEELSRSLDAFDEVHGDHSRDLEQLQEISGELREYVVQLHAPKQPLGMSPYRAMGELAEVDGAPKVSVDVPEFRATTRPEFDQALTRLEELARTLEEVNEPLEHPLRGCGLEGAGRVERAALEHGTTEAGRALARLTDALGALATELALQSPTTLAEAQVMVEGVRIIAESPGAEESVLENPRWNEMSAGVKEVLDDGKRYAETRVEVKERFRLEALERDLDPFILVYGAALQKGILRLFLPSYWKARGELRGLLQPTYKPESAEGLLKDAEVAKACRQRMLKLEQADALGQELFGRRWNGKNSNWSDLQAFAEWVVAFRTHSLQKLLGEHGLEVAARGDVDSARTEGLVQELDRAIQDARECLQKLIAAGQFDDSSGLTAAPEAVMGTVSRRVAEVEANLGELRTFSMYIAARNAAAIGIASAFVPAALEGALEPEDIVPSFRSLFLEQWTADVMKDRPVLSGFRSKRHEERITTFCDLDRNSMSTAEDRARAALFEHRQALMSQHPSQLQLLQREAKKRRNIAPIRKLLKNAPDAIKRVKPCFMMSPLSVAQYLEPGSMHFDLIVFDEASQIPPPDAIGAIIRADQVVVVGDSKQLPPTNFFSGISDAADQEEDEDGVMPLDDLESILDEVAVAGIPSLRLKWHYRSQHESLIRFSNEEFYNSDPLYVFPSSERDNPSLGLKFEHVQDGVYTGKGRNPIEALRVADAVVEHIKNDPELSLGVGTFGMAQRLQVMDELDRRRREDPSIEWFFAREGEKKFFVKNLENIQGDDRDVIFLSVTYGPGPDGRVLKNFGPINLQGGWRRLNVLTTRAKRLLRVFSSMRGDQIDVTDSREGPTLLRQYLKYAETGEYPASNIPVGEPDSPFEESVIRALVGKGYRVVPQVGDAGYRIDIGIIDPDLPGRYICGIECDGASYHSALTVRDRDRLRQQVLELRGWDIHRMWSTDWFHDPVGQIERLVELIDKSKAKAERVEDLDPEPPEPPGPADCPEDDPGASEEEEDERTPLEDIDVPLYEFVPVVLLGEPDEFYTAPVSQISKVVLQVIDFEGPVHISEVSRRVAASWSMQRTGSQIVQRVDNAVEQLVRNGNIDREGDFLSSAHKTLVPVRSRAIEDVVFSSDIIPRVEVEEAIRILLRHRAPLLPDELVTEAGRVLGFKRTGNKLKRLIDSAREQLIKRGELRPGGKGLYLVETAARAE